MDCKDILSTDWSLMAASCSGFRTMSLPFCERSEPAWQASEGEGKGKEERVKREKIGRGRIVVMDACEDAIRYSAL